MAQKDVKLFALSTCIHCRNMKQYLDENHVVYDCVFVDSLEGKEKADTVAQVKQYNPAISFPTLVIGGDNVVVGFKKNDIAELLDL
jgi:glutaredoxin-like protein NrdH